jgi:flavorubredoxin
LVKVFIAYDTKYGNTKLAAESVLEGVKTIEGVETAIGYVKEVDVARIVDFNAIVLGAPNHMGKPSRTMKKFVDRLSEVDVKAKSVAVFGTYSGSVRPMDRAVKKLEKMVQNKLPNAKLISPGLSIRVKGIPGPIVEGELQKCVDFGRKVASQIKI